MVKLGIGSKPPEENDLHLIEAFTRLRPALIRRAMQYTRGNLEDAEDIVSGVVLRFLSRGEKHPVENVSAYLYRALSHELQNWSRGRRRRGEHCSIDDFPRLEAGLVPADVTHQRNVTHGTVAEVLQQLPAPFADILRCVFYEELTYEEAARKLGIPIGTVKSRLHRALHCFEGVTEEDPLYNLVLKRGAVTAP